jgi:hypothetical protein
MGTYIYTVRKRPIRVLIGNEVEDVYPLEFLSRLSLWNAGARRPFGSFDFCQEPASRMLRLDVGRIQRVFSGIKVQYVYMTDTSDYREVPIPHLSRVYRTLAPDEDSSGGLVSALALGAEGRADEDENRLFWADGDELGEDLGDLLEPLRIGRRKGPWEIEWGVRDPELRVYSRGECGVT